MGERPWEYTTVEVDFKCIVQRVGHVVPFPRGSFVRCIYMHSTKLYSDLNVARWKADDVISVAMRDAGVGSVIDTCYRLDPLAACKARIDPPRYNNSDDTLGPMKMFDEYAHMYYLIAFRRGLLWARWDWIEVVRSPDQL